MGYQKTVIRIAFVGILSLLVLGHVGPVGGKTTPNVFRESIKTNVVSIYLEWDNGDISTGQGIIVAEKDGKALILTANHVLFGTFPGQSGDSIEVYYYDKPSSEIAELVRSDPGNDIAIIKASIPKAHHIIKDCLGWNSDRKKSQRVWFIGQNWYLPVISGALNRITNNGISLYIEGLPIPAGTSGGPLIGEHGIIGMITDASGVEALAINMDYAKGLFKDFKIDWQLKDSKPIYHTCLYTGGGGGFGVASNNHYSGFTQGTGKSGVVLDIRVGYVVRDDILLGLENILWYKQDGELVYKYENYFVVLTKYFTNHTFIDLGGGFALVKAEPLAIFQRDNGWGGMAGIGFEFPVGKRLTLSPEIKIMSNSMDSYKTFCSSLVINTVWFW